MFEKKLGIEQPATLLKDLVGVSPAAIAIACHGTLTLPSMIHGPGAPFLLVRVNYGFLIIFEYNKDFI